MSIKINKDLFNFSYLYRILPIIWECSKGLTILRFCLLILQATLPLIPLYLMKLLLDSFTGEEQPEFNYIVWILVGFAVVQVLVIIVSNVMAYISQLQADVVSDHMSKIIIRKAIDTDLEYYDSATYYDIYERAIAQSSARPTMVVNSLTQLLQSTVSLAAIFTLLLTLHWAVSFILVIIAIPIALIRLYFTNKLVSLKVRQTQQERKAHYFRRVLTGAQDAKEVRIFGFGEYLLDRFLAIRDRVRNEKKLLNFNQAKSLGLAQTVEAIAIILALGFIAMRAINGLITVGDIAMYFGAFQKGQTSINNALKALVSMHENRKYLDHLFHFLDLRKKITDPVDPLKVPTKIESLNFSNVSFTYPGTNKRILHNISFKIKKGQLVAIVGHNGSGKSTIVKLLNRLYEANQGRISINGEDITSYRQKDLRKKLTVIFQLFSKYNVPVTENIRLADVHRPIDLEKIKLATEQGLASMLINKLKNGYDTMLGRSFSQGEELSGGEWQKIALSRAFYKDADIVILDEPTSFIDPLAEEEIFNNIKTLVQDKIVILITHRIYNLRQADQIIVLDGGRIIETGNHESLMQSGGLYKEMFEKQK